MPVPIPAPAAVEPTIVPIIVFFVARTLDGALFPLQSAFRCCIESSQIGTEVAGDSVEQNNRIETHLQFAPAVRAAGLLHINDRAGDPNCLAE